MELDERKISRVFKALCDENRVRILKMLMSGEKCACVLLEELNIVQSTLSSHMKILCDSGLVSDRKDGKWKHFRLSEEGFQLAIGYLQAISNGNSEDQNKSCCGK